MDKPEIIMAPGPTPVPPEVLLAQGSPLVYHRGPGYGALLREVTESLKKIRGLRRGVARLKTIARERALGLNESLGQEGAAKNAKAEAKAGTKSAAPAKAAAKSKAKAKAKPAKKSAAQSNKKKSAKKSGKR